MRKRWRGTLPDEVSRQQSRIRRAPCDHTRGRSSHSWPPSYSWGPEGQPPTGAALSPVGAACRLLLRCILMALKEPTQTQWRQTFPAGDAPRSYAVALPPLRQRPSGAEGTRQMRRRPSYQYCCQEAPPVMNLPRTELAAQLRTQYKEPAATRRLAEACGRSYGTVHSQPPESRRDSLVHEAPTGRRSRG